MTFRTARPAYGVIRALLWWTRYVGGVRPSPQPVALWLTRGERVTVPLPESTP